MKYALIAAGFLTIAVSANAASTILPEEAWAREEEKRILTSPIAGIENSLWFDYRIEVTETQKELASDLKRASDIEDLRDAWQEYGHELADGRKDYVDEMAERGYRQAMVEVQ